MPMIRKYGQAWTRRHDDPRTPLLPSTTEIDYPRSLEELIALCRDREPTVRLRAAGSHWALSEAAISDHVFVETHDPRNQVAAMDRTLGDVIPSRLHPELLERMKDPDFPALHGTVVHVEAGKRIYQLYGELDRFNIASGLGKHIRDITDGMVHFAGPWAFATMGGAGGQTVVGAFSTGTHGGDFDRGPLADSVVALHLVADGGMHYWIEPVDRERFAPQLCDDDALTALYGHDRYGGPDNFRIIRDTDIFNAVLVSVGRFGILYSAVLRAVPQYSLWERRRLHLWQDIKHQIADRGGLLFNDSEVEAGPSKQRFLQVVVCLTPHLNFMRNLVGVTKRWNAPDAPLGQAQRVGEILNQAAVDNGTKDPVFSKAGKNFPYSPHPDNPRMTEEPGMLDRACADASFLHGILEEAQREIEKFVESNGTEVGAGVAAVAVVGGVGLLALLGALALFALLLKELLDQFDADDRLGEHMERIKNKLLDPDEPDPIKRAAGLFAWQLIAYKVFTSLQSDLSFGALSYAVMDRKNYLDRSCEHNVASVEVFFDAMDSRLIAFIDALIAFEINQEMQGKAFLGYVSMRFTGPTRALIGMQRHSTTCSVEVAGLKDLSGSEDLVQYAAALALNPNVRGILHWGQLNPSQRAQVELRFGSDLDAWREALRQFLPAHADDGFSNAFTRRTGLEPF
ncbi:MAG: hypothetical protein H7Y19_03555 [Luteimonas sp.]|nr:hypothetical protein [Luteimonas sp.]